MFKLDSRTSGDHPAFEYPGTMAANEAGYLGEAVCYHADTGALTKCEAAGTPDFILQAAVAASAAPTVRPPCIRVDELQQWQATVGAVTPAPIRPGMKLTLSTDGLAVTDTAGGAFQVSATTKAHTANAAVGDVVTGYFRR